MVEAALDAFLSALLDAFFEPNRVQVLFHGLKISADYAAPKVVVVFTITKKIIV